MDRPRCVEIHARYHWMMAGTILLGLGAIILLTRNTVIPLSRPGLVITLSAAALYALTGVLLWYGKQPAPFLNQVCSLLYLTRPRMGQRVWEDIRSAEYKAFFRKERSSPGREKR